MLKTEYLVTTVEMKQYDDKTIHQIGLSEDVLIERAAYSSAKTILETYPNANKILVVAGNGNNGADAVATARILKEFDKNVEINLLEGTPNGAVKHQIGIAQIYQVPFISEIKKDDYDVIIDGIFGIGLNREITGNAKERIEFINQMKGIKVSLDIASGIDATTGKIMGVAIRSDFTITFGFYKRGHFLNEGRLYQKKVKRVRIGINEYSFFETIPKMFTYFDESSSNAIDLERKQNGNKGDFGKVAILAGRDQMSGASILAAESALRSGCGMVCVVTEKENARIIRETLPEAIVYDYQNETEATKRMKKALDWCDVVALGPGLGTDKIAESLIKVIIEYGKKPCIIDADAINVLAQNNELYQELCKLQKENKSRRELIFTPHIKEFAGLMKLSVSMLKEKKIEFIDQFIEETMSTLVLKDAETIVSSTKDVYYLNISGNDALATAGTGDVLTGLIASLMAQESKKNNPDYFKTTCLSTFIHGKAGKQSAQKTNHAYCVASDIIKEYKNIIK